MKKKRGESKASQNVKCVFVCVCGCVCVGFSQRATEEDLFSKMRPWWWLTAPCRHSHGDSEVVTDYYFCIFFSPRCWTGWIINGKILQKWSLILNPPISVQMFKRGMNHYHSTLKFHITFLFSFHKQAVLINTPQANLAWRLRKTSLM